MPTRTDPNWFVGCSSIASGRAGLVPTPVAEDEDKYLSALGDWRPLGVPPMETAVGAGNISPLVPEKLNGLTGTWTYRTRVTIPFGCSSPRFWFAALGLDGTNAGYTKNLVDTMDLKAAVELADASGNPSGTILPLYFNRARTHTFPVLDPIIASDPLGLVLAPGAVVYVRARISNPGGSATGLPLPTMTQTAMNEGYNVGDAVDSGVITAGHVGAYGAFLVTGMTSPSNHKGICIFGTSIEQTYRDYGNSTGGLSYLPRAFGDSRPFVNIGVASSQGQFFNGYAFGHERIFRFLRFCRDAVGQFAINDINGGANLATLQTRHLETVAKLRAAGIRKVGFTTTIPKTNSSDNWQTGGNQTKIGTEAIRLAFNSWLQGSEAQCDFVWDTAAAVAAPTDSGLWRSDAITLDATTVAAAPASTVVVLNTTASYTTGSHNGWTVLVGAEVANVIENQVTTVNAMRYSFAGIPANPTAVTILNNWTSDGVHPSARGHVAMAAACRLSDLD